MKRIFSSGMKAVVSVSSIFMMACSQGYNFGLPQVTDNFAQQVVYNNKVDIIWVMDNSKSMSVPQTKLSSSISSLANKLNSLKLDYHMVVVSTSFASGSPDVNVNGGRFLGNPKVITNTTPNLEATLKNWLIIGEDGSDVERGLDSLEKVVSSSYLSNEGRGFWRDDAFLVIIPFSNEDDKSTHDAQYYVNLFDSLKGFDNNGNRLWSMNSITITSATGSCKTQGNYVEAGYKFMSIAQSSGGITENICVEDYSNALANVQARIVEIMSEYFLSRIPDMKTLTVKVNGVLVPQGAVDGWTYDSKKNSIRFHGKFQPSADASISVDFKAASAN